MTHVWTVSVCLSRYAGGTSRTTSAGGQSRASRRQGVAGAHGPRDQIDRLGEVLLERPDTPGGLATDEQERHGGAGCSERRGEKDRVREGHDEGEDQQADQRRPGQGRRQAGVPAVFVPRGVVNVHGRCILAGTRFN